MVCARAAEHAGLQLYSSPALHAQLHATMGCTIMSVGKEPEHHIASCGVHQPECRRCSALNCCAKVRDWQAGGRMGRWTT